MLPAIWIVTSTHWRERVEEGDTPLFERALKRVTLLVRLYEIARAYWLLHKVCVFPVAYPVKAIQKPHMHDFIEFYILHFLNDLNFELSYS